MAIKNKSFHSLQKIITTLMYLVHKWIETDWEYLNGESEEETRDLNGTSWSDCGG